MQQFTAILSWNFKRFKAFSLLLGFQYFHNSNDRKICHCIKFLGFVSPRRVVQFISHEGKAPRRKVFLHAKNFCIFTFQLEAWTKRNLALLPRLWAQKDNKSINLFATMSDLLEFFLFSLMCTNIYFIHTSWTRRDSFSRSFILHFKLRIPNVKKNPSTVWWCAWMCQKKKENVYISWIAKDKNTHNYTPKCFTSSCSADSPRSKFKHFHSAVFRIKAMEEECRAVRRREAF